MHMPLLCAYTKLNGGLWGFDFKVSKMFAKTDGSSMKRVKTENSYF